MVMILEKIGQEQFCAVVWEFILNLYEVLLGVKNKLLESRLQVLKIRVIFKSKLNHIARVVDLLIFVKYVKTT